MFCTSEIGSLEQFSHQDAKPHLNLIEPRTTLRREMKQLSGRCVEASDDAERDAVIPRVRKQFAEVKWESVEASLPITDIGQQASDLFDPVDDTGVMMHAFDSFDRPKARTIDIHSQAFAFDFLRVAFGWLIAIYELPPTIDANVILFTFFCPILTDMRRAPFRALHGDLP